MEFRSIFKSTILLKSLITIILLFTVSFLLIQHIVYNKIKEDTLRNIVLTTEITNIKISEIFHDTKLVAEQMEANQDLVDYIREVKTREDIAGHPLYQRVIRTLKDIEMKNPHIYLAWVANESANFYLDNFELISDESFEARNRPWYKPATNSTEAAFSPPHFEYTTNILAISCIKAIRENGRIIGFFSVDISLDFLQPILKEHIIGKNGENILLTDNGTVVYTSENPKNKEMISIANLIPYINSIKEKGKEYEEIEINGKDYYLLYHQMDINNWGVIQLIDKTEVMQPFQKTMATILGIFLVSCLISIIILYVNYFSQRRIQQQLKIEASTDYLTGINNRKYFHERSQQAVKDALEQNRTLSCLMIDIDEFKEINDRYGHDIGDKILKTVAAELRKVIRKNDILCRLGGDEFTILLLDAHRETAQIIANRIIENISRLVERTKKEYFHFTLSIGISCLQNDDTVESLWKRADQALYRAKTAGRNIVSF